MRRSGHFTLAPKIRFLRNMMGGMEILVVASYAKLHFSLLLFMILMFIVNQDSRTYSKKFMRPVGSQSSKLQESGEELFVMLLIVMVTF